MRFFSRFKKFIRWRSLLYAAVFALLIFMPLFGFRALSRLAPGGMPQSRQYNGIISIWNIDTFEGGTYSRESMLNEFARAFQEKNKELYVLAQSYTAEEFDGQLAAGNRPDIVSFGTGAGALLKDSLRTYRGTVTVRDDLAAGGSVGGRLFAVPWCMGGYAVFSTEKAVKEPKVITGSKYTLPLAAYIKNGLTAVLAEESTQYTAYDSYTKNYQNLLLGTQRDVYRLGLKVDNAKINELTMKPLGRYTDLVQYMGIFEGVSDERAEMCEAFIAFATSDACQKKIQKLSMFTVNGTKLYTSGNLAEMENALSAPLRVLNAFTAAHIIEEYKNLCRLALRGDETAKKTINGL